MKLTIKMKSAQFSVAAGILLGGILLRLSLAPAAAQHTSSTTRSKTSARSVSRQTRAMIKAVVAKLAKPSASHPGAIPKASSHSEQPSGTTMAPASGIVISAGPAVLIGPAPTARYDSTQSLKLWIEGNAHVKRGEWDAAAQCYRQAIDLDPGILSNYYGLAHCAAAAGDVASELALYRHAIYSNQRPDGLGEHQPFTLMEFAIALSQTGQSAEALKIYRVGVHYLNLAHGGLLRVTLPDFTEQEAALEPERLQSMAYVGIAEDDGEHPVRDDLREAVRLWPTSAVANYYLGENLDGSAPTLNDAREAYQTAWQFGDEQVHSAMLNTVQFSDSIAAVLRANGQPIPGR